MKVKELIVQLEKCDPESHIRMPGGTPIFVEEKEGYWDGPYTYIDEHQRMVKSASGLKVDVHVLDFWDFVDRIFDTYNVDDTYIIPDFETFFNRHFVCELKEYATTEQRTSRCESFKKAAKIAYDEVLEINSKYRKYQIKNEQEKL